MKIVVAEDDVAIADVIKIVLQEAGYTVNIVNSFDHILPAITGKSTGLLLLDVWFAGKNGSELCMRIKKSPQTKHIPVIILSASSDVEEIARKVHADDVLQKPFEIDELLSVVEKHITASPVA